MPQACQKEVRRTPRVCSIDIPVTCNFTCVKDVSLSLVRRPQQSTRCDMYNYLPVVSVFLYSNDDTAASCKHKKQSNILMTDTKWQVVDTTRIRWNVLHIP